MKIYLSLCLALGFCALAALCARADDEDDKPLAPAHDPDVNSPTYDGSTFNPAPAKQVSAEEIQAAREAAEEEDTWLIRSYEQRQKMKSTGTGQADPLDPYQRIASDKDLAKLAGLTATASPNPADITNLRADSDPLKDGATLRVDPSQLTSSPQKLPIMAGTGFKPLITPLSATDVAGLHDFYASLPAGTPPPVLANTPAPNSGPPPADEPPITDMPGLASESHIKQGKLSYELTYEELPDDFPDKSAKAAVLYKDDNDDALPQPPSGDATQQLHRAVLVATTGKTTPPPAPVKVVIPPDIDLIAPKPLPTPIMMGGRPPIQDPFELLR